MNTEFTTIYGSISRKARDKSDGGILDWLSKILGVTILNQKPMMVRVHLLPQIVYRDDRKIFKR